MKLYIGDRKQKSKEGGLRVFFTDSKDDDLREQELNPRLDLINHSPDGFEWGYLGSGPTQLALALLCDALGDDERALMLHQAFKVKCVKNFPQSLFVISDKEIIKAVHEIEGIMPQEVKSK